MYIVCYDIASDRLRAKVARALEGYGRRVQYSVFECDLTWNRYQEMYQKLFQITDGMEDGNICFYYICKNCETKKQVIGIPLKPAYGAGEDVIVI